MEKKMPSLWFVIWWNSSEPNVKKNKTRERSKKKTRSVNRKSYFVCTYRIYNVAYAYDIKCVDIWHIWYLFMLFLFFRSVPLLHSWCNAVPWTWRHEISIATQTKCTHDYVKRFRVRTLQISFRLFSIFWFFFLCSLFSLAFPLPFYSSSISVFLLSLGFLFIQLES